MWHVPDPLNEHEYNYAVDKALAGEEELNDMRDDKDAMEDFKKSVNKYLRFLGPINLTAENSAVHYNESPYTYVLDNPLRYIDPFGLDSLPPFTLIGHKNNNNSNASSNNLLWGLGPTLMLSGIRVRLLKPVGALGSLPGSSPASVSLSEKIPLKFTKVFGRKLGTKIVKKVGTNVIGRALGRFVPYVGLFITMYDVNNFAIHHVVDNAPADDKERYLDALGTAF